MRARFGLPLSRRVADAFTHSAALRIQRALRAFAERRRLRQPAAPPAPPLGRSGRLRVASLIATWYTLSVSLSLYNKHLLGRGRGHFPAPLLLCAVQFSFQWAGVAALLSRGPYAHLRPPPLTRAEWTRAVLPVGVTTAADVGASNMSLIYITARPLLAAAAHAPLLTHTLRPARAQLSFYTMCKSVSPLFLLGFAISMGLERPSARVALSVVAIVAGVACAVAGETQFDARGFALVMLAAALSGLRWALTQQLMRAHSSAGLGHPLGLMLRLLPVMAAAAGACSLLFERLWHTLPHSAYTDTPGRCAETLLLVACSALVAFGMTVAEYALMRATSAVTLGVAGTVKEAASVAVFSLVDGDAIGPLNAIGLLLVLAGVGGYNAARAHATQQHKAADAAAGVRDSGGAEGAEADTRAYAHVADLEEARAPPRHRAAAGGVELQVLSKGGGGEETYTDILNALLTNKTR